MWLGEKAKIARKVRFLNVEALSSVFEVTQVGHDTDSRRRTFMQVQFAFKHMRSSEASKEYAEKKVVEKIEKFVTKPIDILITFSKEGLLCTVHCSLKGGDGFNIQVEQSNEDMRSAVDLMVDRLASQLKRHKEKLKDHKGGKSHLYAVPDVVDEFDRPIDADEVIKFEQARRRATGNS